MESEGDNSSSRRSASSPPSGLTTSDYCAEHDTLTCVSPAYISLSMAPLHPSPFDTIWQLLQLRIFHRIIPFSSDFTQGTCMARWVNYIVSDNQRGSEEIFWGSHQLANSLGLFLTLLLAVVPVVRPVYHRMPFQDPGPYQQPLTSNAVRSENIYPVKCSTRTILASSFLGHEIRYQGSLTPMEVRTLANQPLLV